MTVDLITGDCLPSLAAIQSNSIQTCITSPPYYKQRDYQHGDQIGQEATPDEYIDKLVMVFRAVRNVLSDDGTVWVNIGDTYASKSYPGTSIKPKDLIGIPWMLGFALRDDGWYLRQDIIWNKPNPLPESVEDRCTKAHEYLFLLTKNRDYYYDRMAIAEPAIYAEEHARKATSWGKKKIGVNKDNVEKYQQTGIENNKTCLPGGMRNKRSVWTVQVQPYKDVHTATFPEDLVRPCILATTKPGQTVLDPFSGSGTAGVVAKITGRSYIGIELNPDYNRIARDRIDSAREDIQPATVDTAFAFEPHGQTGKA